jgi:hypothetical protein
MLYGVTALAGPSSAAVAVRRRIAPVLNARPGTACAVVAFAFVLLIPWGPTHALRTGWGILLLGTLIAIGAFALRHQTLREFPAAPAVTRSSPAPLPAGPEADPTGASAPERGTTTSIAGSLRRLPVGFIPSA